MKETEQVSEMLVSNQILTWLITTQNSCAFFQNEIFKFYILGISGAIKSAVIEITFGNSAKSLRYSAVCRSRS